MQKKSQYPGLCNIVGRGSRRGESKGINVTQGRQGVFPCNPVGEGHHYINNNKRQQLQTPSKEDQVTQTKGSVILDIDPGVDDALTLFLMLLSPEVNLRAVTVVRGNTDIENAKRNVITCLDAVYKHYEYLGIPLPGFAELPFLAIGEGEPLNPSYAKGSDGFMGKDGFGDIFTLDMYKPPKNWQAMVYNSHGTKEDKTFFKSSPRQGGPEEILYQLEHAPPFTVTILAVGPLTNLATAYMLDPVVFHRAKQIIIMGGKVPISEKVTSFSKGEFNFACDPDAAHIVLGTSKGFDQDIHTYGARLKLFNEGKKAPMDIVLIPLDVGENQGRNSVTISKQDYFQYIVPLKTPLGIISTAMMDLGFVRDPERHLERDNHQSLVSYDSISGVVLLDLFNDVFDQYWHSQYYSLRIETRDITCLGASLFDSSEITSSITDSDQTHHSHIRMVLYEKEPHYNQVLISRLFSSNQ
ncbi:Inosine/uridine-preferring nucleoside hydrolase domain-containing protein [Phascolomyces articulosus]|uniref:Inosine/uridine-preferring nucleoside hydrolase domain-containing protein n=1 Tax=Phascolomyces articulosus TaxID=60185 RepID=A0AAD5PKQ8_9FUNG|nr:Inosine/uridine-preferring nucleoside hydrolase domain-containing protein [Phascolomyces articulosus]